tara:strand:- start:521 stop:775 length:255 start_codon:yes stop_codon:yes gene_type:complete
MNEIQRNRIRMMIREELYSLVEGRNTFDSHKVLKLISSDKFLSYEWKKIKNKYKGSKEVKGLEYIYNYYIDGDPDLERQYRKIK